MKRAFLSFDVRLCSHCGEVILRPKTRSSDVRGRLRWLHTDERAGCLNQLTREPTGEVAEPRTDSPHVDGGLLARNLRSARLRRGGRW